MFRHVLLCLAAGALTLAARADNWSPNLTFAGVWDSNATNAKRSSDQIDTLLLKADLLSLQRYACGPADELHFGFHGGADWFPRYNGLTSGAAGVRADWRHTFGTGALAPTVSVELAADAIAAKETGRRGTSTGVTFSARKRFNDLFRGTVSYEIARHDARYAVYDRLGHEGTIELDRDLNERTRFTLTGRYRKGDVVSYATLPRADFAAIAPNQLAVESFGRSMTAYSVDARTWAARGAITRALDDNSAVVLSYEYRDTQRSPLSFSNHLLSVALVHQF